MEIRFKLTFWGAFCFLLFVAYTAACIWHEQPWSVAFFRFLGEG